MDFWELTIRFFSLQDSNVLWVVIGSMLLGAVSGGIGSFAYLQKRSLLGDTLAHASLPGVGLAFLIVGHKDYLFLLLGAAITGWLGAISVDGILKYTKIKFDSALGIVLTVFFGMGIVILTGIQKTGSGSQSGLDKFLFGQASVLGKPDTIILSIISLIIFLLVILLFSRFKLMIFDTNFAQTIGLGVGWLRLLMTTMLVLAVTIGLQAVGVVLMAAMLITPAAAARQWTDKLGLMVILAAIFGSFSGLMGAYVSFLAPRFPTGPWMVVVVSSILLFSVFFAPRRGVFSRMRMHYANRQKMTRENLLKALYRAGMDKRDWKLLYPMNQISEMWSFTPARLKRALYKLTKQGVIIRKADMFGLTNQGMLEGARILRLHRLWELYLSRYLEIAVDHVHRDAEEMEHIITPDVERQLLELLDHPLVDPHNQIIPYVGEESNLES